jgi:hypothetical protein
MGKMPIIGYKVKKKIRLQNNVQFVEYNSNLKEKGKDAKY